MPRLSRPTRRQSLVIAAASVSLGVLAIASLAVVTDPATRKASAGFARTPIATPLATNKNRVVTATGDTLILGGIHRTGYSWATGDDISATEADSLAQWSSMIRFETSGALVAEGCANGGAAYLERLDAAVTAVTSRNMVALIDLHNSAPRPCETARKLPLPAKAEALQYWTLIAQRYASNPLVAFELWNEPHAITSDQWVNGATLDPGDGSGTYVAAGMQELYDTVHGLTTANLIFVDPPGYSSDARTIQSGVLKVDAARTVWSMHVYTCVQPSNATCMNDPAKRAFPTGSAVSPWDSLSFSKPIVMTETGFPDPSSNTWFTGATAWSAKHTPNLGIIGFSNDGTWQGSPWRLTVGPPSWAPNTAGQPLVDFMSKVAPAQPTVSPQASPSAPQPASPSASP